MTSQRTAIYSCERCGFVHTAEAHFCPNCGAEIYNQKPESKFWVGAISTFLISLGYLAFFEAVGGLNASVTLFNSMLVSYLPVTLILSPILALPYYLKIKTKMNGYLSGCLVVAVPLFFLFLGAVFFLGLIGWIATGPP